MDMTPQTAWLVAISAVVIVGVVAFFIGRSTAGTKARIDELEAELDTKRAEVEGYRKEVEQHFDKTATLFVSMAGSYKELFEHLSSGYEKLSTGSARALFQQRVDALLIGSARGTSGGDEAGKLLAGAAAAGATTAAAGDPAPVEAAGTAPAGERVEAAAEGAAPAVPSAPTLAAADVGAEQAAAHQDGDGAEAAEGAPTTAPPVADESDARVRMAEGIAFDPTMDEASPRSEAPRSELR